MEKRNKMFHTKLSTVRSATNFAITTNAKNRLPFVSELLENGSIFTGAINSHRNLHVLCIKPAVNARARSFSLLDPKIHNVSIEYVTSYVHCMHTNAHAHLSLI